MRVARGCCDRTYEFGFHPFVSIEASASWNYMHVVIRKVLICIAQLRAVTLHSEIVTLGSGSAALRRHFFRSCIQLRTTEHRFRSSTMSLFSRVKILSPGDFRACSHRWLRGDYTAFAIREWRKSQLNLPTDYIKTGNATIEWE